MGEYEDFVKSIPKGERVPEPFTSLDNRLDFLGPKIVSINQKLSGIESAIGSIGGLAMPVKIEQLSFSFNLLAGAGVTLAEFAPFSGHIKEVSIHWPDGCDGLLDIRVCHGTVQFCPDEGFLALNEATPTYRFNEPVVDHEEIWVEMGNADAFPHRVTVSVTLEGAA